ncbi:MAG: hypothetical protein ACOVQ2_04750 [Flavobacterium sp.]
MSYFFLFLVGERRFAKTPGDLTKKEKNRTTTCHRPTALALALARKKPARPNNSINDFLI